MCAAPGPRFRVEPDFELSYPDASRLATECVLNTGFIADRFDTYVEALVRRCGIPSIAAFNALEIARGATKPLPPSVIAERMVLARGTITAILDSLERRGLVERIRPERDRRMRLVRVTTEGARRALSVLPELHRAERNWLACLTPQQQQTLLRLVAILQVHLPTPTRGSYRS